jgi:predicted DNA-binding protein with PD1-like motif
MHDLKNGNIMDDVSYCCRKVRNKYVISVGNHQEIVSALMRFCEESDIRSGEISGLGAVNEATLRFYDPVGKKYEDKTFCQQMEMANLTGNVSFLNGRTYLHIHVTLGLPDYSAIAGHLLTAKVNGACELFIEDCGEEVGRIEDEETGLNLYRF